MSIFFFFSSRRRHTRWTGDWSSDVCSSDLGRYHLFCAEYCGTRHSGMIGEVVVMGPTDYQTWLSGGAPEGSLAAAGAKLFQDLACNTCHRPDAQGRGPVLERLFGRTVQLQSGEPVTADEAYIRESILTPAARVTAGF